MPSGDSCPFHNSRVNGPRKLFIWIERNLKCQVLSAIILMFGGMSYCRDKSRQLPIWFTPSFAAVAAQQCLEMLLIFI